MFTQFGDIYVHTAGVEIIVIDPNGFQREISFQDFVYMSAKQAQQFRFFCGKFGVLVADRENLFLGVEGKLSYFVHCNFFSPFPFYSTQNGFDTEYQLFHAERFGDVVVGSDFETFENVFFQRFCGQEDNGYFTVYGTYFLCQSESVFLGHHHIEYT